MIAEVMYERYKYHSATTCTLLTPNTLKKIMQQERAQTKL